MRDCLRIMLALFLIMGPLAYSADFGIYVFTDGDGQVHLSNVPDDARYQRLDAAPADAGAAAPAAPEQRAAAAPDARGLLYGDMITRVADRFGIEAALLHAVIAVESGYNARAVSKNGAGGLMQLMPQTAKRYGVSNVFDPADNVRGGAQYLTDLLKLFDNDVALALAAYNAGENAVLRYGRQIPPYRETAAFVPKVVDSYNRLRTSM